MKKVDYTLMFSVIIITIFGLVMISSSSYVWAEYKFNNPYKYLINQGIFFILSLISMYVVSKIDYKILSHETKKGEHIDGVEVAHQIGRDVSEVYKTLVAQGSS